MCADFKNRILNIVHSVKIVIYQFFPESYFPLPEGGKKSLVYTIDYDTDSAKKVQYKVLKMIDSKLNLKMASITVIPDIR